MYKPFVVCTQKWLDASGRLHREDDLPAAEWSDGYQEWYQNGQRHRGGDLPAVVCSQTQEWWVHGKRHRDGDMPAWVSSTAIGSQNYWYQHGELHRDGGLPAVINSHFEARLEWWVHGVQQTPAQVVVARRWSPLRTALFVAAAAGALPYVE